MFQRIPTRATSLVLVLLVSAVVPAQQPPRPDEGIPPAFKPILESRKTTLVSVMGSQAWKHGARVDAVAVSPDGKQGVSGGLDGAVLLWDLATGETIRTLARNDDNWIQDLAYFPDGRSILVARSFRMLEVIDAATGATRRTIDPGTPHLYRAALFPDGKRVAAAPQGYPVCIVDLADGKPCRTLAGCAADQRVECLALTPDGRRILVGTDKTLDIFDVDSGRQLRSIEGFGQYVASIAVTRDGTRCLAGSGDGTVRLLDLESGTEIRRIEAHSSRVEAVAFTHGDTRAFTGSDDSSFALFDLGNSGQIWREQGPAIRRVVVTPDGKAAFTASMNDGVMLWDLETGCPRGKVSGHQMELTSLWVDDDRTVTGSPDGTIRIWNARGREERKLIRGHGVFTFAGVQEGPLLAIADHDRGIALFDLGTDQESWLQDSGGTQVLEADPKCRKVIGVNGDRRLTEWKLAEDGPARVLARLPEMPSFSVKVEPTAGVALVFSRDSNGSLDLWDLATGKPKATLRTTIGNGSFYPLAISPDGNRAVTSNRLLRGIEVLHGEDLVLWDLEAATPLQRYTGHEGRIVAACLTPDACRIISASEDRKVRIFGTECPDLVDQIDLGLVNDRPRSLALSRDGRTLLVGTARGIALRFEIRP